MRRGIIHRYRKWWPEVLSVVIRVKGDFVQINVVALIGDL